VIHTYYRDPSGTLQTDLPAESLRRTVEAGEGLVWVDLEGTGQEETTQLLREVFGFHPLTIDDCLNGRVDPPKVDDYGTYLFFVFQALGYEARQERITFQELDLYLGKNYVVTFHAAPVTAVEHARTICERGGLLMQHAPDYLAHGIIDRIVDDLLPLVEAIDDEVALVEEAILDRTGEGTILESVLLLRRNTLQLRRAVAPQRDLMNRISRGEFTQLIQPELNIYFRDIYDHLVRVEDMIASLRDAADGALSIYLSATSNRLNEIMKVLSIVATVILPLTLVTGIYGMNFRHMPELESPWGYPAALGVMVLLALVLLGYFKRRGWL
jgi:magnesium transporter